MIARMDKRNLVVHDCLCPDGKRRAVRLNNGGEADTFFSIPATVSVSRKDIHRGTLHVAGYVTGIETDDGRKDYAFRAVSYRRNCFMFPEQFLIPGTEIEMIHGEMVFKRGRISHWAWDDRPYWQGPPRWLVIVNWDWYLPEAYGPECNAGGGDWQQEDAQQLLTGVYVGNYKLGATGDGIGPVEPFRSYAERTVAQG